MLDVYTAERWSRNIAFFGDIATYGENKFAYQKKIQQAKLCLLGCGGLGTHLLFDFAATGFQHITIVDFDTIELSNLNRQILYHEADIGKVKVQQAKKRILDFAPRAQIHAIETRLDSTGKVASIVKGHDLVICVADQPRNNMIYWLNEACIQQKVPFINGGVDIRRGIFYTVLPGKSGCVHCWKESMKQQGSQLATTIIDKDKELDVNYTTPTGAPAMVALVAVVAGCIVSEAIKITTGIQPPSLTNQLKAFSFDDLTISTCGAVEKTARLYGMW